MPALIPQQRPDKNNKIVIRWVKADASAPASLSKVPSPGIKKETLQQKHERLFDSFDLGHMKDNQNFRGNFRGQISYMREDAVDLALDTLDRHQDSPRVNYAVQSAIKRWNKGHRSDRQLLVSIRFAAIESVYEQYLKPSPLGNPTRADDLEEGIIASLVMRNDEADYGERELTEAEESEAVLGGYAAAATEMHTTNISKDRYRSAKVGYWEFFQDHGDLVGVFSEFSDRLEEMTEYVYQNGPDAGALRQHMRGDHMALADGAL
jgi:hypothetical protein